MIWWTCGHDASHIKIKKLLNKRIKIKMSEDFIKNNKQTTQHGLNIFYYGAGKGKTTATAGLAARAAGAGMNVFILQFVKARKPEPGKELQGGEWPISSEINFFETVYGLYDDLAVKGAKLENISANPKVSAKLGQIICEQAGLGFVGILGDSKERQMHVNAAAQG